MIPDAERARAVLLFALDLVREERGLEPVCGRCLEPIGGSRTAVYRCVQCRSPYHYDCARAHFHDWGDGGLGPVMGSAFANAVAIRAAVEELRLLDDLEAEPLLASRGLAA